VKQKPNATKMRCLSDEIPAAEDKDGAREKMTAIVDSFVAHLEVHDVIHDIHNLCLKLGISLGKKPAIESRTSITERSTTTYPIACGLVQIKKNQSGRQFASVLGSTPLRLPYGKADNIDSTDFFVGQ